MSSIEKAKNSIIRNSGKAIANSVALVGVKVVDGYAISKQKSDMKEIGIDAAVMAGSTFLSGTANSALNSMVSLPGWVKSLEYSYGVDLITLIIYVALVKLIDMKMNYKSSFVKVVLEAVVALIGGSYIINPLNNYLPLSMKA